MNTKHTPGPWTFRKQVVSPVGTRDLFGVGPVRDGAVWFAAENCSEADALLIAAAPELLVAAQMMDLHLMRGGNMHQGHILHVALRAALSKAGGK